VLRTFLSEHLTCWTLEIEESFIKTDVLHFFVFHEEEDVGRGPGEGRVIDQGCWGQVSASLWGAQGRGSGPVGCLDSGAGRGLGGPGVAFGPVSPSLTGRAPGEGPLEPAPLGQRLFGAEDVCYRTS